MGGTTKPELLKSFGNPFLIVPMQFVIACVLGSLFEWLGTEALLRRAMGNGGTPLFVFGMCCLYYTGMLLSARMAKARVDMKVPHPVHYPCAAGEPNIKDRYGFMTYARAHGNYLEVLPLFLALAFSAALLCDRMATAGAASVLFAFARVLYGIGYTSGHVNGRLRGLFLSFVSLFGLLGIVLLWAIRAQFFSARGGVDD